jgi:hypothetical protein
MEPPPARASEKDPSVRVRMRRAGARPEHALRAAVLSQ